jgi:hypothetical protein
VDCRCGSGARSFRPDLFGFFGQHAERHATGRVPLEKRADDRPAHGIDGLRLPGAAVEIPERSAARQNALLQASVDALQGFLAEVPDVLDGKDHLDVRGEAAAVGAEVHVLVREVNVHPLLDQLVDVGPVAEVARAAVDFVDYDAVGFALPE